MYAKMTDGMRAKFRQGRIYRVRHEEAGWMSLRIIKAGLTWVDAVPCPDAMGPKHGFRLGEEVTILRERLTVVETANGS